MIKVFSKKDGYAFGELALLRDQPRFATVRCDQECHLASLDR